MTKNTKSPFESRLIQWLDHQGPYAVSKDLDVPLLGEGQLFERELQGFALDWYIVFIAECLSEGNSHNKEFARHRSVQTGEFLLTQNCFAYLHGRLKTLRNLYKRDVSKHPFPGLLPLSILIRDGHCDADIPLKDGTVRKLRVWKKAREIESSGYRALASYLLREARALEIATKNSFEFNQLVIRYTSFHGIGLDALYESSPFEHRQGYFFPDDCYLAKRTIGLKDGRCFVLHDEKINVRRISNQDRVGFPVFDIYGKSLLASLSQIEEAYILLVAELHKEFGVGRSEELYALREFFLKYQEVSGLRTNGLMALSLLLLFDLGFTKEVGPFKNFLVSGKDKVFCGFHPRGLSIYCMDLKSRSAISGFLVFKGPHNEVFELKMHSIDFLGVLKQDPLLEGFFYNTLSKCCRAAVKAFRQHPEKFPGIPKELFPF